MGTPEGPSVAVNVRFVVPFAVVVSEQEPFPVEIVPLKFQAPVMQKLPQLVKVRQSTIRRHKNASHTHPRRGAKIWTDGRKPAAWRMRGLAARSILVSSRFVK